MCQYDSDNQLTVNKINTILNIVLNIKVHLLNTTKVNEKYLLNFYEFILFRIISILACLYLY